MAAAVTNYDVSAGVTFAASWSGRKDGRVIQHRGRRTTPICGGPSSRAGRRIRQHGVNIYKGGTERRRVVLRGWIKAKRTRFGRLPRSDSRREEGGQPPLDELQERIEMSLSRGENKLAPVRRNWPMLFPLGELGRRKTAAGRGGSEFSMEYTSCRE